MFKQLLFVASLTTVSKQHWEQQRSNLLKIVLPSVSKSSKQLLLHKPVVWHRFSHAMWKINVSFLGRFRTFRACREQSERRVRKELKGDDAKCLKTC